MTHGHSFWFFLTWGCVAWYCTTTFYVAVKGSLDIRDMLRRLKHKQDTDSQP